MGLERVLWAGLEDLASSRRGFIWNNLGRLFAQDPPKGKVPVPTVTKEKEKELMQLYQTELSSKTPEAIDKMFQDAIKTNGPSPDELSTRYALLDMARNIALGNYDFTTAFKIIDKTDEFYEINAVGAKATAFEDARKKRKTPEQTETVAQAGLDVAIAAVSRGMESKNKSFYELAAKTAKNAGSDAKTVKNQMISDKAEVIEKYSKDLSGNGPTGELAAAKWAYFILNDEKALDPLSKQTTDAKLKKYAGLMLFDKKLPGQHYELGDVAFEAAGERSRPAFEQRSLLEKALDHYNLTLNIATGVEKTKYERDAKLKKRIEEVEKKIAGPNGTFVDLIKLIDPSKDTVSGKWSASNGMLKVEANDFSRIEIPYAPPAEYDFTITFARKDGTKDVIQFMSRAEKGFEFHLAAGDGTAYGFFSAKQQQVSSPAVAKKTNLENGRRYTSVVKVRKDSVSAYLDGKLISEWKPSESDLGWYPIWALRKENLLGIGSHNNSIEFYRVYVTEVSGKGKLLR